MATPGVPNQFMVGKNRIVHKPTAATFSFDKDHTTFKSINWGNADEQLSSGEDLRNHDWLLSLAATRSNYNPSGHITTNEEVYCGARGDCRPHHKDI